MAIGCYSETESIRESRNYAQFLNQRGYERLISTAAPRYYRLRKAASKTQTIIKDSAWLLQQHRIHSGDS